MRRAALALLLSAVPAMAQPAACPLPGQVPMLIVQMFFGQSRPDRTGPISRRAWARFVADTITPALPAGFTIVDATGQWQDPATGIIGHEPTELLIVAAPDGPELKERLRGIADAYRRRFDQRAVGIVTSPGCAAF